MVYGLFGFRVTYLITCSELGVPLWVSYQRDHNIYLGLDSKSFFLALGRGLEGLNPAQGRRKGRQGNNRGLV